ncbi:acyltransferase family-domain-containing protein [Chaetomium strumarium]|uniref:Acyltransferase family-domain-containing protein n=1 Tax=Chaetomium strumarium TaxID=1170767 RepID=A0AAJ0M545_9PEZI|nr:acyltransferase family-domain-containing protein [Chaetomium strumarium]
MELNELASNPPARAPGYDPERQLPAPAPTEPVAARGPEQHSSSTAFLDGLRGLAAFFVFIQHTIGSFDYNAHEHGFGEAGQHWYVASLPFVRILFNGGGAAVAIFFVLSGYVLSRSPLRLVRDGKPDACFGSLASAVVRRPIRLYAPPLAVTLAFALLLHAPFHLVQELPWPKRKDDVFLEVMNWVVDSVHFFNPFRAHSNEAWFTYSIVVWTIPIELKGSMLVYGLSALHALGWLPAPRSVLVWSIAAAALLQTGFWTMACFIGGLILACLDVCALDRSFLSRHCDARRLLPVALHHAAFLLGYYLLCQPAHDGNPEYSLHTPGWQTLTRLIPRAYSKNQYYRYWNSWGALLLVFAALRIPWLQRLLRTRPLRYLGRVSFMFYLVHLPMQYMVGDRLARALGHVPLFAPADSSSWWDDRLRVPDVGPPGFNSRFLLATAVMLPLNLVVADFLTRALDVPCVRLGKRLVQRLGLEKRVASRQGSDG